jgi:hypothetical protein
MEDPLLESLQRVINKNFKDALIWDQTSEGLNGKYFYVKYDGKEIGVFMGYITESGKVKGCTVFFFVHPVFSMSPSDVKKIEKLFHRIMVRANLNLRNYPYKLMRSGLPALVRSMYFTNAKMGNESFFEESITVVKQCEASYLK